MAWGINYDRLRSTVANQNSRAASAVNCTWRQRNPPQKNQNHADADAQNNQCRNPEAEGLLGAIESARRASFIVALAGKQTKPRPAYARNSYQQEWHRSAPLMNACD